MVSLIKKSLAIISVWKMDILSNKTTHLERKRSFFYAGDSYLLTSKLTTWIENFIKNLNTNEESLVRIYSNTYNITISVLKKYETCKLKYLAHGWINANMFVGRGYLYLPTKTQPDIVATIKISSSDNYIIK